MTNFKHKFQIYAYKYTVHILIQTMACGSAWYLHILTEFQAQCHFLQVSIVLSYIDTSM